MISSPYVGIPQQTVQQISPFSNLLGGDQQTSWDPNASIDWNFINELDPILIKKTKDVEALQSLINSFSKVSISPNDKNLFNHPLTPRLFQLVQVILDYLLFCQKTISTKLSNKSEENEKMRKKIKFYENSNKKLESSNQKLSEAYKKASIVIEKLKAKYETCPVCHKRFQEGDFLDKHFDSKHSDLAAYWKAIRTQRPMNVAHEEIKDLIDQIKELKMQTKKTQQMKMEETQKKIKKHEIEEEDPLMSTHENLSSQLFEAAESLESANEIYQRKVKNNVRKKPKTQENKFHISSSNPFAQSNNLFNQQQQNGYNQFQQQQYLSQCPLPPQQLISQQQLIQQQQLVSQQQFIPQQQQIPPQHLIQQQQPIMNNPNSISTTVLQNQTYENVQQQASTSGFSTTNGNRPQLIQNNFENKSAENKTTPKDEGTLIQAKNFLDPRYRESKYKFSEEQMEKMISSVTNRIQQEIAGIKCSKDFTVPEKAPTNQSYSNNFNEAKNKCKIDPKTEDIKSSKATIPKKQEVHPIIKYDSSAAEYSYNDNSDANDDFVLNNSSTENKENQNTHKTDIVQSQIRKENVNPFMISDDVYSESTQNQVKNDPEIISPHNQRKTVTFNNNTIQVNQNMISQSKQIKIDDQLDNNIQSCQNELPYRSHQSNPNDGSKRKVQTKQNSQSNRNTSNGENIYTNEKSPTNQNQNTDSNDPNRNNTPSIKSNGINSHVKLSEPKKDNNIVIGVKFISNNYIPEEDPYEIQSAGNTAADDFVLEESEKKEENDEIIQDKADCFQITNDELNDLIYESSNSNKSQSKNKTTRQNKSSNKSDKKKSSACNNVKNLKENDPPQSNETKITNSELDDLLGSANSNKKKPTTKKCSYSIKNKNSQCNSHSKDKRPNMGIDKNPANYDFGGLKVTNSELEELLCESGKESDQQEPCSYANSTFAYHDKTFTNQEINEILGEEEEEYYEDNFNENRNHSIQEQKSNKKQLTQLPKPPKMTITNSSTGIKDKFDFSYLNDIPGPRDFEKMKMKQNLG